MAAMKPSARLLVLLVLALALLAAPAAEAGLGGRYKGKTKQNYSTSFKVRKGKVVRFRAGINLFCPGGGFQVDAVSRNAGIRIGRGGRFKKSGEYKDGSKYTIAGRIGRNGRARGEIKLGGRVSYTAFGNLTICANTVGWSAKKQ